MRYIILFVIVLGLYSCQTRKYASGSQPKKTIIPSEMSVEKLMIEGKDRTKELGQVRLTESQWSEYDRKGNVIGVAEILSVDNRTIKVKWTMAKNGADVGEVTFYDYLVLTDKVVFTIWKKNKQKGYFEASLAKRDS